MNLSDACLRYNSLDLDDDYFGCLFKGETIDGTYDLLTLRSKIASLKQGLTVSMRNDRISVEHSVTMENVLIPVKFIQGKRLYSHMNIASMLVHILSRLGSVKNLLATERWERMLEKSLMTGQ